MHSCILLLSVVFAIKHQDECNHSGNKQQRENDGPTHYDYPLSRRG